MQAIMKTVRYLPLNVLYETRVDKEPNPLMDYRWTVPLPGVVNATNFLTETFGVLEVTDAGLILSPFNLQGGPTSVLFTYQQVPVSGSFNLEVPSLKGGIRVELNGGDRQSKKPAVTNNGTVFVLSRQVFESGSGFNGALLVVVSTNVHQTVLRLESILTWHSDPGSGTMAYLADENPIFQDRKHKVVIELGELTLKIFMLSFFSLALSTRESHYSLDKVLVHFRRSEDYPGSIVVK